MEFPLLLGYPLAFSLDQRWTRQTWYAGDTQVQDSLKKDAAGTVDYHRHCSAGLLWSRLGFLGVLQHH